MSELTAKALGLDDIPTIIRMAAELHLEVEESWPDCPEFNEKLVFEQVWQCMYIKMMFAFGLFDSEKCVGAIVFTVYPCFGIGDVLGKEAMWYVEPAYRSGGLMLLSAFEKLAREKGAGYLEIGHFSTLNIEKMSKMYTGLGYSLHQLRYLKKVSED